MKELDKRIIIVGCGPGAKDYITQRGIEKIKKADVLVGSKRLMDLFPEVKAERILLGKDYKQLPSKLLNLKDKLIAVLVSGDPGFFSLSRIIVRDIGIENCEVIPGISSAQLAFARIGEDWDDARFISLHGRDNELDDLVQIVKNNDKVAVLTDMINNPSMIGNVLLKNGVVDRRVFVLENLSLEDEAVHKLDINSMCGLDISKINIVIFLK